jgi:hypothetical protein
LNEELNYLEHVVTSEGVKLDIKKVQAVVDFSFTKSVKDVNSSLHYFFLLTSKNCLYMQD